MGFLSEIFSATVKTVLLPVAVVKDVVNVAVGSPPDATKKQVQSIVDDAGTAIDDLSEGEL